MTIAGVVVLYNPDEGVLGNLLSYAGDLGRLWVVDNSEQTLPPVLESWLTSTPNVEWVRLGENRGIACALNEGARRAWEQGFEWLLTMDQDSVAPSNMVARLHAAAMEVQPQVAIVAAVPSCSDKGLAGVEVIQSAFTSGNLVCLAAWHEVGGWDDKLFIDSVDFDFDFRLQIAGWGLVQINDCIFPHSLGALVEYKLWGKHLYSTTNHSYVRRYYITRNRLYVNKTYASSFPDFVGGERLANLKDLIKILLSEDDKLRKIKSMWWGWRDFRRGIWGKRQW